MTEQPVRTDTTLIVDRSLPSKRLDSFLCTQIPDVSRGTIQRLMEEGHILLNGSPAKPTSHPHLGDKIEIHWPTPKSAEALPEDMPLDILFEDESLLVVNKPPGLVVHPSVGHEEHTLVNALLHHCEGKLSGIGGVARPGIVHRLDKDTSGCLVVAKSDAAHISLSEQFAGRTIEKIYNAILCGELPKGSGDIRGAIARHEVQRKKMAVTEKGRDAHTSFHVLEKLHKSTLVEAYLHTGRTHQIRVHFQHAGYPIVGDDAYGERQNKRLKELTGYSAPRQMLHAHKLSFVHPITGETQQLIAPLPKDFEEALKALKKPKVEVPEPVKTITARSVNRAKKAAK